MMKHLLMLTKVNQVLFSKTRMWILNMMSWFAVDLAQPLHVKALHNLKIEKSVHVDLKRTMVTVVAS